MQLQISRVTMFVLTGILFSTVSFVYAETAEEYSLRTGKVYAIGQGGLTQAPLVKQAVSTQTSPSYSKGVGINSTEATEHYQRGIAYYNQGNFIQAVSEYTKAIEINPSFADAYDNRGNAYDNQGNFAQALSDYNKAIEINPNHANAYRNRGVAYANHGNASQAILDFSKAIELDPNFGPGYRIRAVAYYSTNEYDKAWADVHKAEALGSLVPSAFINSLKKVSGRDK
jgi:tetratricopeptide (TPR) repeat protein